MSKLILLAEDSFDDALVFKRALRKAGILNRVEVVRDGFQAIAYIAGEGFYADRERFPEPGILFLDLVMPRADGWFVLNWLATQPQAKHLLTIVLTGVSDQSRLQDVYSMGAQSFLYKPIQAAEIRGLIEFWPAHWQLKSPGVNRLNLPYRRARRLTFPQPAANEQTTRRE